MKNLRILTYNIHKGVQGWGGMRRLEIHNLRAMLQSLHWDISCLQEVRQFNLKEERFFLHWPAVSQAEFLAPSGYHVIYQTNAVTKHGEHGNAIISRFPVVSHFHRDISDHRFEQRGLLHTELDVEGCRVHVICVHLGLIRSGRLRQLEALFQYVKKEIDSRKSGQPLIVAGDFNDGSSAISPVLAKIGLLSMSLERVPTFPSRIPLFQLDHIYARGLTFKWGGIVPGKNWQRYSDHLPLMIEASLCEHCDVR